MLKVEENGFPPYLGCLMEEGHLVLVLPPHCLAPIFRARKYGWWSAREKERGERGLTCRQRNGGLAVFARGFQSFQSAERESRGSQAHTLHRLRERNRDLTKKKLLLVAPCTSILYELIRIAARDSGIHTRLAVQILHKGSSKKFFDGFDRPCVEICGNMPKFGGLIVLILVAWHQPKN